MKIASMRLKTTLMTATAGLTMGVLTARADDPAGAAAAILGFWDSAAASQCNGYGYLYTACMADFWAGATNTSYDYMAEAIENGANMGCPGIGLPQTSPECSQNALEGDMWQQVNAGAYGRWQTWASCS